jgi:hypothetical protein
LNLHCLNLTPPWRQRRARPGCEQISAGDPEAILFGGARVMHGHVCGFWILEPFSRWRSKSLFFDRVGPKLRLPLNFGCRSRFRFRCFRRSNPDQNLLRIPNLVSDLSGDQQFYVIFRSRGSAILGAAIRFLKFVWEDTATGRHRNRRSVQKCKSSSLADCQTLQSLRDARPPVLFRFAKKLAGFPLWSKH